jgi:hypothetical protein
MFTNNIQPLVYLISGFVLGPVLVYQEEIKSYFMKIRTFRHLFWLYFPVYVILPKRFSLMRLYEGGATKKHVHPHFIAINEPG